MFTGNSLIFKDSFEVKHNNIKDASKAKTNVVYFVGFSVQSLISVLEAVMLSDCGGTDLRTYGLTDLRTNGLKD